ncbi:MAG: hypothetical protein EPO21_18150 [Chloroflexota bacterium]|nr:MAG: hypothetical protein EPO21_18150 [Chloroflexota bacterium]
MIERKISFCRICECSCGVVVTVEDGRIVQVEPDRENPLSAGHLCIKGKCFPEVVYDPDRLLHPVKRVDGGWQRIGWAQAIDEIGERLAHLIDSNGARAVAGYIGGGAAFYPPSWQLAARFLRAIGSPNRFSPATIDAINWLRACEGVLGDRALIGIPEWGDAKYMLVIGANPLTTNFSMLQVMPRGLELVRKARQRGAKVVMVNPRRPVESMGITDEHLFIVPSTDVFFVMGLINVILREALHDKEYVASYCSGLETLRELVADYTPEATERITGIPADKVVQVARDFARARGAFAIAHTGVSMAPNGTLGEWAVIVLNAITGNLDRPGGLYFDPGIIPSKPKAAPSERRPVPVSRVRDYRLYGSEFPCSILADEILMPGEGQIRALIVTGGNPMLSFPNANKLERALDQLDLLVCIDRYVNETATFADYVLPATTFFERPDVSWPLTPTSAVPFLQWADRVIEPLGESKTELEIFRMLYQRLGIPLMNHPGLEEEVRAAEEAGEGIEAISDLVFTFLMGGARVSLDELKQHPHGLIFGEKTFGQSIPDRLGTPDKKIHLAPEEFVEPIRQLEPPVPDGQDNSFILICRRFLSSFNTSYHNAPSLRKVIDENFAEISAHDAGRLDIADGEYVTVQSKVGRVIAKAKVSDDIAPGVVAIPHGWGHVYETSQRLARQTPGVNPNVLIDDEASCDPFTGNPAQNGTRVWVTKGAVV